MRAYTVTTAAYFIKESISLCPALIETLLVVIQTSKRKHKQKQCITLKNEKNFISCSVNAFNLTIIMSMNIQVFFTKTAATLRFQLSPPYKAGKIPGFTTLGDFFVC